MLYDFSNLSRCELVVILKSSIYLPLTENNCQKLDIAFERFINSITRQAKSKKSNIEKLRAFTCAYELFELIKNNIRDHTSLKYLYAQSACSILNFEKRAILLQLKYPGLSEGSATRHAPFRLSKKYTPTDLMEIITPLHAIGFFCLPDGSPVSFAELTKELETLCGIKFKNPETCRWAVLNRKNKLTYIIDTMRRTLLELSVK